MAFFYMGFSPEDDIQNRESITPFIDETRNRGDMDVMTSRYEIDFEFWPIEHPLEPSNEDRPVKCPMPNSSLIKEKDGSMHEEQSSESSRKRADQEISKKEQRTAVAAADPSPVRALRKRHHTLTSSVDHAVCPLQLEIFPSSICFSSSTNSNLDNSVLD